MIVVCSPNYSNQEPPLVVRVQNAGTSSFEVSVDRADGSNVAISGIDVHYLVVEEGVYTEISHEIKMEAAKFNSGVTDRKDRKGSWTGEMRTYANTYLNPVVLGQIMTHNDERFSVFWSRGTSKANPPSASALWVGKHIGEDPDTVRSNETIGYIVFEAGLGMINGQEFLAEIGGDSTSGMTNGPPHSYALSGLSSASVAVVSSAGMDGGDGGLAGFIWTKSGDGFKFKSCNR